MAEMLREADRAEWKRTEKMKWEDFERERENAADRHRRELEKAQALHEAEVLAIRTDAELTDAQKRARVDVELARFEKQKREIKRAIEQADFDEKMRQRGIVEEQEQKEILNDLTIARQSQEMMAENKRRKEQIRLDAEQREREIARLDELERQTAAHDLAMEKERLGLEAEAQKQAHELAMLQARAEMSAEALISLSGPEQARVLADIKQTEALKDLSDEQVYAMMAAKSPQVAAALAERFKAMQDQPDVAEEIKALYERMLENIQKDKERDAELRARTEQRYQDMFNKALDSQREGMVGIAQATSHQPQQSQGPTVVFGPGGGLGAVGPQVINPGAAGVVGGEVQICPKCHARMAVGTKFCTNCGYKFFE